MYQAANIKSISSADGNHGKGTWGDGGIEERHQRCGLDVRKRQEETEAVDKDKAFDSAGKEGAERRQPTVHP